MAEEPHAPAARPVEALHFYKNTLWRLAPTAVWVLLILGGIGAVVYTGTAADSSFLERPRISKMLAEFLVPALLVPAMVLIIAAGGIDLSIGTVAILSAYLVTFFLPRYGANRAALTAIGIAAGVGLANGLLVSLFRIRAAVATLGTMVAAAGVATLVLASPAAQAGAALEAPGFLATLTTTSKLPWGVLIGFAVVGSILVQLTPFGRRPRPTDPEPRECAAARLFYTTVPYLFSGLAAGCVGVYLAAGPTAGHTLPLLSSSAATDTIPAFVACGTILLWLVIAPVLLGGTPPGGGFGTVLGGLLAALLLVLGANLAALKQVPEAHVLIGRGAVIVLAALLSRCFFGIFAWRYRKGKLPVTSGA